MAHLEFIVNTEIFEKSVHPGETLLETALREGLPLAHSCGGMGTCGTCRVLIRKGLEKLPPPEAVEAEMMADRGFLPIERLACQNLVCEGVSVEIPLRED